MFQKFVPYLAVVRDNILIHRASRALRRLKKDPGSEAAQQHARFLAKECGMRAKIRSGSARRSQYEVVVYTEKQNEIFTKSSLLASEIDALNDESKVTSEQYMQRLMGRHCGNACGFDTLEIYASRMGTAMAHSDKLSKLERARAGMKRSLRRLEKSVRRSKVRAIRTGARATRLSERSGELMALTRG